MPELSGNPYNTKAFKNKNIDANLSVEGESCV